MFLKSGGNMTEIAQINSANVSQLTQEQIQYVMNVLKFEEAKANVKKSLVKQDMDMRALLDTFLAQKSINTQKTYRPIILDFLNNVSHVVDITPVFVDQYIEELTTRFSPATVRLKISALSSFVSKIVRWQYLDRNPFIGCELPKDENTEVVVPTQEEVVAILDYAQVADRKIVFDSVTLMSELGVRVGAIEKLFIDVEKLVFESESKGKRISGKISQDILDKLNIHESGFHFSRYNKPLIQFHLDKCVSYLAKIGKVQNKIHAHSFRHFYAVKLYKYTKDIYEVSRKLHHSSVTITQRYLRSINLLEEL
jgi:site-specific recombinase XerD